MTGMWAGDLERGPIPPKSSSRQSRRLLRGKFCTTVSSVLYSEIHLLRCLFGFRSLLLLISAQLLGFGARLFDQIPSKLQFWIPTSAPFLRAKAPPKRPPGPIPRPTCRAPGVPPSCPELPLLGPVSQELLGIPGG